MANRESDTNIPAFHSPGTFTISKMEYRYECKVKKRVILKIDQLQRNELLKQKSLSVKTERLSINMAATYSPALLCSTMGHEGLNFSVRYGKR